MAKTLFVCCDGTWNTPDQQGCPTNITKLARAILPATDAGEAQIVYYDEGVGTGNAWDRFMGGALGLGLAANVQQAYRFLALNYLPGDRIVMFGFSRGAFTVRSLAGLVSLVGLLRKGDLDKMPLIWEFYRTPPTDRGAIMIDPAIVAHRPDIDVLGVFDTVGSLGIPGNLLRSIGRSRYAFHDVRLGKRIKRAYQALAVDEYRKNFQPAVWDTKAGLAEGQIVEQAWFAGAHSNVGGGYPDSVLSDAALLWMMAKTQDVVAFDQNFIERRIHRMEANQPRGAAVDSWKRWWKFFGRHLREIGQDPTEVIDPSVSWRIDATDYSNFKPAPYRPRNVLDYLRRRETGAAAAEEAPATPPDAGATG